MPCFGGEDYIRSFERSEEEYRAMERKAEFFKSALCASFTLLESKVPGFLQQMDWTEAGVLESEVAAWWTKHKREDAKRRHREQQTNALRQEALSKLTLEELVALGLVKKGTAK